MGGGRLGRRDEIAQNSILGDDPLGHRSKMPGANRGWQWMTELIYGEATAEDAANLAALSTQVWLHTYATAGVRNAFSNYVLSEFTAEKLSTDIAEKNRRLFIKCEKSQHLVGYLRLDFESPSPSDPKVKTEIATLYVQEHHARQGIGRGLLEQAALACRTRNVSDFWLSVNHENHNAIRFYDSLSFKRDGSMYFELDGEKHENFILRRSTL